MGSISLVAPTGGGGGISTPATNTDLGAVIVPASSQIAVDGSGHIDLKANPTTGGTSGIKVPVGTSLQRPTAANGLIRYNSDLGRIEFGNTSGTVWVPYGTLNAVSVTYATPLAVDCSQGEYFTVTLTGNLTLNMFTNMVTNVRYVVDLIQDATGGRTITFATGVGFYAPNGLAPALSSGASAIDTLVAVKDPVGRVRVAIGNSWTQ